MPTAACSRSDLDLSKIDWTKVDAATDEEIARQAAEDADTAPIFSPAEILAAGQRIEPALAEDVRALHTRLGLIEPADLWRNNVTAALFSGAGEGREQNADQA